MLELVMVMLMVLSLLFFKQIFIAISILMGDRSICQDVVDDCVSVKDQIKEDYRISKDRKK